jgi:hypothetical protein
MNEFCSGVLGKARKAHARVLQVSNQIARHRGWNDQAAVRHGPITSIKILQRCARNGGVDKACSCRASRSANESKSAHVI